LLLSALPKRYRISPMRQAALDRAALDRAAMDRAARAETVPA
jgi:hypothetical protein